MSKQKRLISILFFLMIFSSFFAQEVDLSFWKDCTLQQATDKISTGFIVNTTDENEWTPLLYSVRYNPNVDVISLLIQSGADVNKPNLLGWTPLLYASQYDNNLSEKVSVLISAGANPNARNYNGWTPLMQAARYNPNSNIIKNLISAGAKINSRNEDGKTSLILAAAYNNAEIVQILIDSGAVGTIIDDNMRNAFDYAKENKQIKGTETYWALCDIR